MGAKRLTKEQISKIQELAQKNYNGESIAHIVGCSKATANLYRKKLGLAVSRTLTEDQINKILNMSVHRYTQDRIAEEVGCSMCTVRYYQQKNGLPASNRSEPSVCELSKEELSKVPSRQSAIETRDEKDENPQKVVELPSFNPGPIAKPVQKKSDDWIDIEDAAIRFRGNKTGFAYGMALNGSDLTIDTGYCKTFTLDVKDLVSFGNELLDIAEKFCKVEKAMLGT